MGIWIIILINFAIPWRKDNSIFLPPWRYIHVLYIFIIGTVKRWNVSVCIIYKIICYCVHTCCRVQFVWRHITCISCTHVYDLMFHHLMIPNGSSFSYRCTCTCTSECIPQAWDIQEQGDFSLAKGTYEEFVNFYWDFWKGTKAKTRGNGGNCLCCFR